MEGLLKHGGTDLIWHKGFVTGNESWSPLKVARFMYSGDATYTLLTPPEDKRKQLKDNGEEEEWEDGEHEIRTGDRKDQDCFMCLTVSSAPVVHFCHFE